MLALRKRARAVARNVEEAQKLVDVGFEYVCDFGAEKLFKKRK